MARFEFARSWVHAGKPHAAGDTASVSASTASMLADMGAGRVLEDASASPLPVAAPARDTAAPHRRKRNRKSTQE